MCTFGRSCTRRSTSVVLPVPDGAETMNSSPRRPGGAAPSLLDILDLLSHLLELRFRVDDQLRDADAIRFCTDGVDLAVHFLQQEIELAPARLRSVSQRRPMREVGAEPRHFLGD